MLDATQHALVKTITDYSFSRELRSVAVSPDGLFAYVTSVFPFSARGLVVIDLTTTTVVDFIDVPGSISFADIAIRRDGRFAYVTNYAGGVSIVDLMSRQVVGDVAGLAAVSTFAIETEPGGDFAYVTADHVLFDVAQIDLRTNTVVDMLSIPTTGTFLQLAVTSGHLLVTDRDNDLVHVFLRQNGGGHSPATSVPVGDFPFTVAATPDGGKAYVANLSGHTVSVLDLSPAPTVSRTIPVAYRPGAVEVTPDGSVVYVAHFHSSQLPNEHNLFVIDTASDQVVARTLMPGAIETWDLAFAETSLPGTFGKTMPANLSVGQSIPTVLNWGVSVGATSYEYCIDTTDDGTCDSGLWTSTGSATTRTLDLHALQQYYWQVRARNATGVVYADAENWWRFRTSATTPIGFSKSSPADGATDQANTLTLAWNTSPGAVSYEFCVDVTNNDSCDSGNWISTGPSTNRTLTVNARTSYYWQVRARNAVGLTDANGAGAFWTFTTGSAFTDGVLTPGVAVIREAHVIELRNRVDALRARFKLPVYVWTDAGLSATVIKAVHVMELRDALAGVYSAAGRLLPIYTDSALASGVPMKAIHIQELRDAVVVLE